MTIESLEKRKQELQTQQAQLQSQHAQLIANSNAIAGAIQDCDYWLSQFNTSSTEPVAQATS